MLLYPASILLIEDETEREFVMRLYEEHRNLMYGIIMNIVRDRSATEDLINDACVALIKKISLLQGFGCYQLRSYVVSTSRNTALNFVKKRSREAGRLFYDADIEQVSSDDVEESLMRQINIDAIKAVLRELPARDAEILRLHYFLHRSGAQIAAEFSIKPESVRVYLSRARKKARALLEKRGDYT